MQKVHGTSCTAVKYLTKKKESVKTQKEMQNTALPKNRTRENQQNIMQEHESEEIAHTTTELTYSTCGGRI